ncbi:serine/threonine-protein kinase PrkC [Ruminiclostridium hungatei]|uniref:non-specific serine/threonine protein kinase n=1 Tax=Ruminiclostridium hungatei TaxID=48256 RepID=A0A1V4SEL7_RUMHU|nr:Stk1 family PASTA domain-containing Ser/Thr kinase [Ruminiclostridium hungatei]OPX42352.1 serine/threonine-protein kinase PrkC [Ruminiclostridium hungatei]
MEGQILGNRYLLLEKIGGGGMAVVYKAKCTLLNRFVAIKVLRSEFTNDEEFVKRFKVEAQAVASLSHPNVVSIYDVGHQEDIHYIVMEYVDGMTLKEFINKHGAIDWQDAIKITIQICSAIEHAHKNNIVHRDIKPHNILLTKEGIAKVTDFGIARAVTSSTITMVGSTIGSVHYFSPEQARGGFIDEKSDLYSLGIALYEMVTGKVPFDGDTPVSVALKHIQEIPVEPHKLVPSLPYGVNEIIMKAIQKEQNVRYQSATSMINDLNRVLVQPQGGFVGRDNINGQSTIRMKPVNSSRGLNESRSNEYSNKQNELKKEKKKTNVAYWLAGITSVAVIIFVVIMAISLLTKGDNTEPYKLDNYVGREYEAVKAELEGKGFKITPTWQESETIAKGMIIDQSIPPGTDYKSGNYTSLELTVSSGRRMSKVPEVKDREYREAQKEMESSNLKSRIEKEFNDDIEADYVIRTEPAAGEEVDEGTEVIIYVSKGKETKRIKVPNLVGKNEEEAQKALADNKLQLGTIIPAGAKGIVNKQLPAAYSEVEEGETVTIWLTVEQQSPATDTSQQSQPSDNSSGKDTETQGPADTSQPSLPVDNQNKNTGNEGN